VAARGARAVWNAPRAPESADTRLVASTIERFVDASTLAAEAPALRSAESAAGVL
jgi:hypothetical protein